MREFSDNRYQLTRASGNMRLVLGLFLVLTLLGYVTNLVMTYQQTGFSPEVIATYYRGSEDASGEVLAYPKSAKELLMNAHFHLYMMPLVLLVLCHVFYMLSVPDFLKKAVTWVSFLAVFGEIGTPWAIRYVSGDFALLLLLSSLLLAGSLMALILAPLFVLWFGPRESSP